MSESFDAIVIGAGQSGPPLAVRCGKEGLKTAVIERHRLGGTCVNNGCIPTKALVASARAAHVARTGVTHGVMIDGGLRIDMARIKARKDAVVQQSRDGVRNWLANAPNVTVIDGHARFVGAHRVQVGDRVLEAPRIFVNVGGRAAMHERLPVAAAIGDIFVIAADVDLGAFADDLALGIEAGDHRGLAAAMADGADLAQLVGDGEQLLRAGEKLALEVGAQAIGHDGDVETVDDMGELPDLVAVEELLVRVEAPELVVEGLAVALQQLVADSGVERGARLFVDHVGGGDALGARIVDDRLQQAREAPGRDVAATFHDLGAVRRENDGRGPAVVAISVREVGPQVLVGHEGTNAR